MDDLTELDNVNPYYSKIRRWICERLAIELPNTVMKLASNDGTAKKFEFWTGATQASLENAWSGQGYWPPDPANKIFGWHKTVPGGATTTSCEGLIKQIVTNLCREFVPGKKILPIDSFNLAGVDPMTGKEKTPANKGWHWYSEKTDSVRPRGGDFFQVGVPLGAGKWRLRHVGVITSFFDGDNPRMTSVEAGQGGPSSGADWMMRKGPRPIKPIDPKAPEKVFMGWLDIDEFFEGAL